MAQWTSEEPWLGHNVEGFVIPRFAEFPVEGKKRMG